jgi:predicted nucleotidyltransferase
MKSSLALDSHRLAIHSVIETHHAFNPRTFGSVVLGTDSEESDLDILIDPTPDTTFIDIGAIRHELIQLLGVPVVVLTPNGLAEKFHKTVLADAVPI